MHAISLTEKFGLFEDQWTPKMTPTRAKTIKGRVFLDMDRFGGEEDRPPWAEVEGVNAGPVHPLYFILPVLLLSVFASIWTVRRRRKRREP